jgi:hypothetical protein
MIKKKQKIINDFLLKWSAHVMYDTLVIVEVRIAHFEKDDVKNYTYIKPRLEQTNKALRQLIQNINKILQNPERLRKVLRK